jgi:hypothetical protein
MTLLFGHNKARNNASFGLLYELFPAFVQKTYHFSLDIN